MSGAPIAPDPLMLNPANPHPVHELRRILTEWWDATNAKGNFVNRGKDFPCHMGRWLGPVMSAFRHALEANDLGALYDPAGGGRDNAGCWRLYDGAAWTWARVPDKETSDLFVECWLALTGWHISANVARATVEAMALQPAMICRDWNLPAQAHEYVTLAGDGTLILIDGRGGLGTRPATREDRLTPEKCAVLSAPWTPGAACPVSDGIVDTILMRPDPAEHMALVETYWAAASQMLLRGDRPRMTRRAVVIWGEAFTGKSVLLKVLRAVADGPGAEGRNAVCQTSLENFDENFGLAQMPGCVLWLVDETTEGYQVKNVATFKQLVDDAPVTVNAKHAQQIGMRLGLTIFIATNSPPSWLDVSRGTSSRVLSINVRTGFVPAKDFVPGTPGMAVLRPDEAIYADLVTEQAGILQKLARAACAMVRAGAMPVSRETLAASDRTFAEEDRTAEFAAAAVIATPPGMGQWVSNNNIVRAFRGMIYDAGGGREEGLRHTTLTMRKRLFNRLRLMFKCETKSAWHDGKPLDAQHGIWLTAQGKEWLCRALQHDDNMRQDLNGYMPLASRANGPIPSLMGDPKAPLGSTQDRGVSPEANVVPMLPKGTKPRPKGVEPRE